MLAGALAAALGAASGGPWTGVATRGGRGDGARRGLRRLITVGARPNQIIAGTAVTLAGGGSHGHDLPAGLWRRAGRGSRSRRWARSPVPGLSRVPLLGPALFVQPAPTYIALLADAARLVGAVPHPAGPGAPRYGRGGDLARAAGVPDSAGCASGATVVGGGARRTRRGDPGTRAGRDIRGEDDGGAGVRGDRDRRAGAMASRWGSPWRRCSSARRPRCSSSSSRWGWRCRTSSS